MELATTLKSQGFQEAIREVGINPNHWYPVSWADQIKPETVQKVVVWQQAIAVYRDSAGQLHALEDACPHKGVELHRGEVQGQSLVCPYHGWQFDPEGKCVNIPYFPKHQKLPCALARPYPVQERYGIVWVFPGDPPLSTTTPLPEVPEFNDPDFIPVPITGDFRAHFSICNENTLDVFHGFLHRRLNGWFNPILLRLEEGEATVEADYRISYRGWISKFLRMSEASDQVTTRTISLRYHYPHYHSSLEGVSSIHLMRLPVGPTETRSFSLLFIQLRLPRWLRTLGQPLLIPLIRHFLFMRFLAQDVEMIESEQRNYLQDPQRRHVEVNPAIIALQRVIVRQYKQYLQQSRQFSQLLQGTDQESKPLTSIEADQQMRATV